MTETYILDDSGNPVFEPDSLKWAKQLGKVGRHVANDSVGEAVISTVFLGIDHNHSGGRPLLFETMIFGGTYDQYQERYSTRDEAIAGHSKALALIRRE